MPNFLQINATNIFSKLNIFTGVGKIGGESNTGLLGKGFNYLKDTIGKIGNRAQNGLNAMSIDGKTILGPYLNGTNNVATSSQKPQINNIRGLGTTHIYNTKEVDFFTKHKEEFKTDPEPAGYENAKNSLTLPRWGIKDYLNERTAWIKGVESLTGSKGFSYFKVFFNFSTNNGLLGDIISNSMNPISNDNNKYFINTANGYLSSLIKSGRFSADSETYMMLANKQIALKKFVKLLSYINTSAPWFFDTIDNFDDINKIQYDKLSDRHALKFKFKSDAIDMRVTTLFDLYKFACYDNIYFREIIPENLRKFDMQVVFFQVPIKYYQTSVKGLNYKNIPYKSIDAEDPSNKFSFKMYEFKNCEFDINTLTGQNTFTSEKPFDIDYTIDITYNRVYEYNMNEWMQMFFGANNIYWDRERDSVNNEEYMQDIRYNAIKDSIDNIYYYNPTSDTFKSLVDASEDMIMYSMRMMDNKYISGNVNDVVTNAVDNLRNKGNALRNRVSGFIDTAAYRGRRYLGF